MTYYVFESDTLVGTEGLLYARIHPNRPDYSTIREFWHGIEPLKQDFPDITFIINEFELKPDNYNTATVFDLYSERLISLLRLMDIKFEIFPVTLLNSNFQEIDSINYSVFRLLDEYPAFDMERSVIGQRGIEKIVLTNDFLTNRKMMARVSQHRSTVLIHSNLRQILDSHGVTGCRYTPVSKYNMKEFAAQVFGGK